jgi:hypothetical protein
MGNFGVLLVTTIIVYLCVYALINRICQCIEHCATAKSFDRFINKIEKMDKAELEKILEKDE